MIPTRIIGAFLAAILIGATPAMARSVSVDAPGDILLFGLGVTGLIIGRQISKHRKGRDPGERG